jgi:hypothetical protein
VQEKDLEMTRLKKILTVIALIGISGTLYGCYDYFIPHTWNYRITVEIDTPEGIKAGSVVRQVQAKRNIPIGNSGSIIYRTIGEALVVDLGEQRILLELPDYQVFLSAFPSKAMNPIEYYNSLELGKKVSLNVNKVSFINFYNINMPDSIRTVSSEDFEMKFGPGIKIKNIMIEITGDPVSWGQVRHYLRWYDTKKMGLGRWNPEHPDPAKYLTKSSLIKGEPK